MYQYYQVMICLLKFDFFAFTGVTMQVTHISASYVSTTDHVLRTQLLIVVLSDDSAEFGITVAAIPCVLAALALCGYALQREIKW